MFISHLKWIARNKVLSMKREFFIGIGSAGRPFPWGQGIVLEGVCSPHPFLPVALPGVLAMTELCSLWHKVRVWLHAGQEVHVGGGGAHTGPQSQRLLEVALEKFQGLIAFAQPGRPPGGPCLPLQHPLSGDSRQPREIQQPPCRGPDRNIGSLWSCPLLPASF